MSRNRHGCRVFKLVLTGGPCGGKTTGQERLAEFFESMGWKVYRVPETATLLQKGGVVFPELTEEDAWSFQESIVLTMLRVEETFFRLAETSQRPCLIICDRGLMDPKAYMKEDGWAQILAKNNLHEVDMRDDRYHQVVHLTTAADGAEDFYTQINNSTRTEGLNKAKDVDMATQKVWIGHPYFEVVTNTGTRSFDDKILKLIAVVSSRAGVESGDRVAEGSRKRKWLVKGIDASLPFPSFQEFDVIHTYLTSANPQEQVRVRRRGQDGRFSYSRTIRRIVAGEKVETRQHIGRSEYDLLLGHRDEGRADVVKKRRSFLYKARYFQLDVFSRPLPPNAPLMEEGAEDLVFLETYTTLTGPFPDDELPPCLKILREITLEDRYSMAVMSRRGSRSPPPVNGLKLV